MHMHMGTQQTGGVRLASEDRNHIRRGGGHVKDKLAIATIVGAAVLCIVGANSISALQGKTIWDGVYTEAQAVRGEQVYAQKCAGCHAANLMGNDVAPSLINTVFKDKWNDMPVGQLYDIVSITMPQDQPGTLTQPQSAEVLAYMLQKGGFPGGPVELSSKAEILGAIKFQAKKP